MMSQAFPGAHGFLSQPYHNWPLPVSNPTTLQKMTNTDNLMPKCALAACRGGGDESPLQPGGSPVSEGAGAFASTAISSCFEDPWSNPMADAVYAGDAEGVRRTLAAGYSADWELDWGEGWTVLHEAARSGFALVARVLLAAGADPHACYYRHGETPLHVAALHGDGETVRALLEFGAEVDAELDDHDEFFGAETPLGIAVEHGHAEAVCALLLAGADLLRRNSKGETPLLRALRAGQREMARAMATLGSEAVNGTDSYGQTALIAAVRLRDAEAVRRLLELGADPDAVSRSGDTALHVAIELGFEAGVDVLLSGGAAIDIVNGAGETPLHVVARQGGVETARALLLLGADVSLRNAAGQTAAELARRSVLRELLLAAG